MPYRAFLLKLLSDLRASYWFIPTCLVLAAVLLAEALLFIDRGDAAWRAWIPESFVNTQIDGARTILSVIAQSVIGVAGVMFSVTMVAVSFASGNFGPRLIGNFMRDRGNQWSLGILISTFVYALLILRSVQSPSDTGTEAFVPQVSVVMAMALALISTFVVIYFVHHVPETISVSNISAALGRRFCAALADSAHDCKQDDGNEASHQITLGRPGYVQRVEIGRLDALAEENNLQLRVLAPPGTFVHQSTPVLALSEPAGDDLCNELCGSFALGQGKTEDQNAIFIAEQQVEMIARALSPGVNDPFTAMDCLNWLAAGIAAGAAKGTCFGLEGTRRVAIAPLDFDALLGASFGASRPYADGDEMVRAHWSALLDELAETGGPTLRQAIAALRAKFD